MDILNGLQPTKNKVEARKQVKKELKKIGSHRPRRGHTLFKLLNDEVTAVKESDYFFSEYNLQGANKKRLQVEVGASYLSALNKRNAIKKFKKIGLIGN